jgi:hypothetical protein
MSTDSAGIEHGYEPDRTPVGDVTANAARDKPRAKPKARSKITNGLRMLDGIDGRSAIARRLRDIVYGLEIEFEVTTDSDRTLVKQAAVLSVLSERLQTKLINDELVDAKVITNLAGQLRRILADLRRRIGQQGPPPPSLHEHLSLYGKRLNDDDADDEDGD